MSTATERDVATDRTEALVERLFDASIATLDLMSVYLGDRLGYYRALTDIGEATSDELARHTDTHERYTREWLEQQAVTNILDVTGPTPAIHSPAVTASLGDTTRR